MKLTSVLFADFLKCPTKCYLRSTGQAGSGNAYATWLQEQNDAYGGDVAKGLIAGLREADVVLAPSAARNLKAATWRLAVGLPVQAGDIESRLSSWCAGQAVVITLEADLGQVPRGVRNADVDINQSGLPSRGPRRQRRQQADQEVIVHDGMRTVRDEFQRPAGRQDRGVFMLDL